MDGVEPLLQRGNRPRGVLEFCVGWYRLLRSHRKRLVDERFLDDWFLDRRRRRRDLARELRDGFFEIGIVARECERRAVLRERCAEIAAAMMNLTKTANRREIFGSALENVFELALRLVELIQFEQRASERDV